MHPARQCTFDRIVSYEKEKLPPVLCTHSPVVHNFYIYKNHIAIAIIQTLKYVHPTYPPSP